MQLNIDILDPVTPHPKLPGTIFTAAEEINDAGGRGIPIECDIRSEESVQKAVEQTVREFGGIDIVINNGTKLLLPPCRRTTSL
jgi:citronellol/citronellal dehydrogenase